MVARATLIVIALQRLKCSLVCGSASAFAGSTFTDCVIAGVKLVADGTVGEQRLLLRR